MFDVLTRQLFATPPQETLYHYTSLSGLLGIIGGAELRASDIRYMNDSAELRHTLELLARQVRKRIQAGVDDPVLLNGFLDWLSRRVVSGPMLFGASFRANGNLLSQWRGYSVHGKGVSLGLAPADLLDCCKRQGFEIGRCIYATSEQDRLIDNIIDAVEQLGATFDADPGGNDGWLPLFRLIEEDLLRIAAVLKHPAFEEEQEWRIISPAIEHVADAGVLFREGSSMLIPYYPFALAGSDGCVHLEHCYLGPTGNSELSMNSLRLYLESQGARPRRGISYCAIPYRKR